MSDVISAPKKADRPRDQRSFWQTYQGVFSSIGSPVLLLVLWEIGARTGFLDARILPPPTSVAVTIWQMIENDELLQQTGVTALRFFVGMIVGTIPGTLLGLTMGLFRPVRVALKLQ